MREVCFCGRSGDLRDRESALDGESRQERPGGQLHRGVLCANQWGGGLLVFEQGPRFAPIKAGAERKSKEVSTKGR